MFIPKHSNHHHHHTGAADSSPKAHYNLFNNPITLEITMMIAVISFAMLLLLIAKCLRPRIAPDDYAADEEAAGDQEEHSDFTLTEDDTLIDNESGRPRQYGSFYTDGKFWYNADGYVSPTCRLFLPPSSQKY